MKYIEQWGASQLTGKWRANRYINGRCYPKEEEEKVRVFYKAHLLTAEEALYNEGLLEQKPLSRSDLIQAIHPENEPVQPPNGFISDEESAELKRMWRESKYTETNSRYWLED